MKCRATSTPIDKVETDCAVLSFFEDERPLKGMTGLADWRLCGSLSRYIMNDHVSGKFGESLLFPVDHRLIVSMVMVFGLGKRTQFDFDAYSVAVRKMVDALFKMHVGRFVMALPGITGNDIDPGNAAIRFTETLGTRYSTDAKLFANLETTVVAFSDQLKKINPVLAKFEKRTKEELRL
jgi:Cytosol aminopeptidase family, N-terminal domain